jgi:hypothetical protein
MLANAQSHYRGVRPGDHYMLLQKVYYRSMSCFAMVSPTPVPLAVLRFPLPQDPLAPYESIILDFLNKTKYSSHVCPGSFISHTRTKRVHR